LIKYLDKERLEKSERRRVVKDNSGRGGQQYHNTIERSQDWEDGVESSSSKCLVMQNDGAVYNAHMQDSR